MKVKQLLTRLNLKKYVNENNSLYADYIAEDISIKLNYEP